MSSLMTPERLRKYVPPFPLIQAWGFEVVAVLGVALLTAYWRWLWLEPVEIGGDALRIWEVARHFHVDGSLPETFNHHTARFGLVIPTIISQALFGDQATTYYIGPIAAGVLLNVSAYGLARKLSGPVAGVLAVVFLLAIPELDRPSSQILGEIYGPAYVMAAYLALAWVPDMRAGWPRWAMMGIGGLFLLFAYGTKLSFVYFFPGAGLLLFRNPDFRAAFAILREKGTDRRTMLKAWAEQLRLKEVGLLVALVVGLIVVQSLALKIVSGETSQLAIVNKTHGADGGFTLKSWWQLLDLYENAGRNVQICLAFGLMSALGLLGWGRDWRSPRLAWGTIIFLVLLTFVVRKIEPLTPWFRPHPRYIWAVLPMLCVLTAIFVNDALRAALRRVDWLPWFRAGRATGIWMGRTAALVVLVMMSQHLGTKWDKQAKKNGWAHTERMEQKFSDVFEKGIPIATRSKGAKPLYAVGALYVKSELMRLQSKLRPYEDYVSNYGGLHFLHRDVPSPRFHKHRSIDEVNWRMKKNRCVVELNHRYRHFSSRFHRGDCTPLLDARARQRKTRPTRRTAPTAPKLRANERLIPKQDATAKPAPSGAKTVMPVVRSETSGTPASSLP